MRLEVYPRYYKENEMNKALAFIIESSKPFSKQKLIKPFSNPVAQDCVFDEQSAQKALKKQEAVEVFFRPGVTDNVGKTASELLGLMGIDAKVASGEIYYHKGVDGEKLLEEVRNRFANSLIQRSCLLKTNRFDSLEFPRIEIQREKKIQIFDLNQPFDDFFSLTQKRTLALSREELMAIITHYKKNSNRRKKDGPSEGITDVELEVFAQTWSEHCKHKIFSSIIDYNESDHSRKRIGSKIIEGIFSTYIKRATEKVLEKGKRDFVASVFKDNAGIIHFDENLNCCFKVETHNSPSALDPYGGALTGILGVNRDILGAGLGGRPLANTDIFCLPPPACWKSDVSTVFQSLLCPQGVC